MPLLVWQTNVYAFTRLSVKRVTLDWQWQSMCYYSINTYNWEQIMQTMQEKFQEKCEYCKLAEMTFEII